MSLPPLSRSWQSAGSPGCPARICCDDLDDQGDAGQGDVDLDARTLIAHCAGCGRGHWPS